MGERQTGDDYIALLCHCHRTFSCDSSEGDKVVNAFCVEVKRNDADAVAEKRPSKLSADVAQPDESDSDDCGVNWTDASHETSSA